MEALLAILPVSLSSGINLYLTLFAMGVAHRAEMVTLPAGLDVVGSTPVLAAVGVLVFVEFFADKIPYVDSLWDVAHTFIRPAGALLIALNLVPAEQSSELAMAMGLLAGTTALTAHSGKASLRAMVNASPEPVSNSVVSTAEDVGVLGLLALTAAFPLLALFVGGVLLVGILIGLVFFFRWAGRVFGSVWGALRGKPRLQQKRKRPPEAARRI